MSDTTNVLEFLISKEAAHDYGIEDLVKKAYKEGRKASRYCQTIDPDSGEIRLEEGTEIEIALFSDGAVAIRIFENNRKRLDGEEDQK